MKFFKIALWILIALVIILGILSLVVRAATNISQTDRYAWSDVSGWWDFYGTQTVIVKSTRLEGYASSSIGEIALDCKTTPSGDICSNSNFGVCNGPGPHNSDGTCPNGDASGLLSGWAWNDAIGWISFCGTTGGGSPDCPSAGTNYQVAIDSNGNFSGYAWNDIEGWISFNCANHSGCGSSNYKVNTSWRATSTFGYLESQIFDTQVSGGATLQSIIWQGSQPAGTGVDFQIAVSQSPSGPWVYKGPGGSTTDYYGRECPVAGISNPPAGPNKAICIDKSQVANYRYLRYKVRLKSNVLQTLSPRVDDIILNWSR